MRNDRMSMMLKNVMTVRWGWGGGANVLKVGGAIFPGGGDRRT